MGGGDGVGVEEGGEEGGGWQLDNIAFQTHELEEAHRATNQPTILLDTLACAPRKKSNLASFNSFFARFVTQGFSAASCLDIDALSSAVRPKCQHQAVCPVIEAIKPVKPVFSSRNFPEKHTEFRLTILTLNVRLAPFTTVPLSPFYLILEKQTK